MTITRLAGWVLLAASTVLGACNSAHIANIENQPIPLVAQRLQASEMEQAITSAVARRGWKTEPAGPGKMIARFKKHDSMQAVVQIAYTSSTYSITLIEAVGTGDSSSENYWNRWMRNMAHDIQKTLEVVQQVQPTAGR